MITRRRFIAGTMGAGVALAKATFHQRITHFTETLDFVSEADKNWEMGSGILERLKWA